MWAKVQGITPDFPMSTKTDGTSIKCKAFSLSEDDIEAYAQLLAFQQQTERKLFSIKPVVIRGITAFYVVNLEKGWQIISSDKRGPIVLAESNDGNFNIDEITDEEKSWFNGIGEQIISRINAPEEYYSALSEEGYANERLSLQFWNDIRGVISDISMVVQDTLQYESVDHLIPVCWHQNSPFNNYCPLVSQNSTYRCPAGCVAIAGAQTLYYLHYYFGHPVSSPSTL